VAHPDRARVFGHPVLIALIKALGDKVRRAHLPILPIGDLAQVRGGPAPTGHASHQTGLDVDVAYLPQDADGKSGSVVDVEHQRVTARFTAAISRVLALFVAAPEVDRVFVNPAIKKALCSAAADRAWLRKVRPWWGHHDHFHVRLACPADSPLCEAQPALPDGDGCGELDWWFRKNPDREEGRKGYQARVGATPTLPEPCMKLVAPPPPP
jgi:penicillin-insensitive murein endopeptidase